MKTLLAVALTSHLLDETQAMPGRVWRDLRPVVDQKGDVAEWAERFLGPSDLSIVRQRLELLPRYEEELEALAGASIVAISEFDPDYPRRWIERLGGKHPPLTFVWGNAALLNDPSIGVVGSRDVDAAGALFAEGIAREAVKQGYTVVSGGARGVDRLATRAAYDAAGSSIGILADSLEKLARSSEMAELSDSGKICLATPFAPSAGFSVGNAMARNKLIYAHSAATVVVSSAAESGGTWSGAIEALSGGWRPVLVRNVEHPEGNLRLIKKGGIAMSTPDQLFALIDGVEPLQASLL